MRIILLGAPGTGKGTQAKFIEKKYNITSISTGDILRKKSYSKDAIGKTIKNIIKKGKLVPDSIVCYLIKNRIKEKDCKNGFILDGFPRNIEQAIYLSVNKITINFVLNFYMPYQYILERISGRRIHLKSGRTYHIKYNPPKIYDKDDLTGDNLTIREDDKKESVERRLKEYEKIIDPLKKYYLKKSVINQLKFFTIDSTDSILNIKKKIEKILKNNFMI